MSTAPSRTLRLLVPQWQGGESRVYPLGARLLEWLAPASDAPTIEIPVAPWSETPLPHEHGVAGRGDLLAQQREIRAVLDAHRPERVVIFGGDCLVDLAPFAYLNERYDGQLGVLWIDAHPDVATPRDRTRGHTMILGSLLGDGDPAFAREVSVPLHPDRVMCVGLEHLLDFEEAALDRHRIRRVSTMELRSDSAPVLSWLAEKDIRHLAIHLDLDVLDPALFRSLGFSAPGQELSDLARRRSGTMTFEALGRLVADVSSACSVVGLGITEHMPWDALNLQDMLGRFPILKDA